MSELHPKVSVIFPIYNNSSYLRKCINSVITQTLQDIEIILIDDGSTDGASQICDSFLSDDQRVIVIHKENEGSAKARNVGIEHAKGEYIAFVESDDAVRHDMYELLYHNAKCNDLDIIKCGFLYYIDGNPSREYSYLYTISDESEVFCPKDKPEVFLSVPCIWAGLYKKSFVDKYGLRFIETPKASYSDYSWMMMTFAYAKRVSIYRDSLYFYTYDNPESSYAKAGQLYKYMFIHAGEANRIIKESGIYEKVKEYLALRCYTVCIHSAENVPEKNKTDCFIRLREVFGELFNGTINGEKIGKTQKEIIQKVLEGDEKVFYEMLSGSELNFDLLTDKKVVIFGMGACGQNVLMQLRNKGIQIVLLIDNNPQPNLKIYPPDVIDDYAYDVVLVTVAERDDFEEMKKQLAELDVDVSHVKWAPYINI